MAVTLKVFYIILAILCGILIAVALYFSLRDWSKKERYKSRCRTCQFCCGIHDNIVFCLRHSVQTSFDGYCPDYRTLGNIL